MEGIDYISPARRPDGRWEWQDYSIGEGRWSALPAENTGARIEESGLPERGYRVYLLRDIRMEGSDGPSMDATQYLAFRAECKARNARAFAAHRAHEAATSWAEKSWGCGIAGWCGQGTQPAFASAAMARAETTGILPGWLDLPTGTEIRWSETGTGGSRQFRRSTSREGMQWRMYFGKTTSCRARYRLELRARPGYGAW